MNKYDMDEAEKENLADNRKLALKLKTANACDFDIVQIDGPYPYAASWAGCADIALFRRRADCKRFIETFKGQGLKA